MECVKDYSYLTIGKKYLVHSESKESYSVKDNDGDINCWDKEDFKIVSEREVLEFEAEELIINKYQLEILEEEVMLDSSFMVLKFNPDISLKDYNIKVIATTKDKTYEGKSREELIEIINELKAN